MKSPNGQNLASGGGGASETVIKFVLFTDFISHHPAKTVIMFTTMLCFLVLFLDLTSPHCNGYEVHYYVVLFGAFWCFLPTSVYIMWTL